MQKWKSSAIVFSLATALLVTGITSSTINKTHAAPYTKNTSHFHHKSHKKTIDCIKNLAAHGKTINSENFGLESKTRDIVRKWGKPSADSTANRLYYDKRGISLFAHKGKVTKILSGDKRYFDLSYQEIKQTLGTPIKETKGKYRVLLTYKVGKNKLELAFYFNDDNKKPTNLNEVYVSKFGHGTNW